MEAGCLADSSLEEKSLHLGVIEGVELSEFTILLHLQELVVADSATETRVALLLQSEEVVKVLSGFGLSGGGSAVSHTEAVDLLDLVSSQVLHTAKTGENGSVTLFFTSTAGVFSEPKTAHLLYPRNL